MQNIKYNLQVPTRLRLVIFNIIIITKLTLVRTCKLHYVILGPWAAKFFLISINKNILNEQNKLINYPMLLPKTNFSNFL